MIVEVRTYTISPGCRHRFLHLFGTRTRPLQESLGIDVAGPWTDLERPDSFVWMRAFPSIEQREAMKRALYDRPEWTGELEAVMMPMLADFTSTLVEIGDDEWARMRSSTTRMP